MLCLYNENLTKFILTNSELATLLQQYAISSLAVFKTEMQATKLYRLHITAGN